MALQPDPGYYPAFSNGKFQLYQYEPFFYRFSYTPSSAPFSNTSVNLYGYLTADSSGVTFAGADGYNTISSATGETMVLVGSGGAAYSNTVFAGTGRFTDTTGSPLVSNVIVYANEPYAGISFKTVAAMNPATAFVQPFLPAQLQFVGVNSNLFQLQGLPAATTANTSYLFVASNSSSQVVSSIINIQVKPERVQLFGGPVNTQLLVGHPITPITFTSTSPVTASNLFYSLPSGYTFPSGLGFTDVYGNPVAYTFQPTDPSGTVILTGTPTIDSPTAIAKALGSSNSLQSTLGVQATSVFSGVLSNSTTLTFSYRPTMIFTQPTNNTYLPALTVGLPVPTSNAYLFNAKVAFGTGSYTISSIYALDLPAGLSLSAVDTLGNSYLTGTPTAASSGMYAAVATSTSGITGVIQFGVTAVVDVVTLTPFVDNQLTFVIGRPLSNALDGYYSSNLSLTAISSTGLPLTFSYPQFERAGITATSSVTAAGTVITFSGTPTVLVPSTFGAVSASDSIASAAIPILFSVVDDVFTWSQLSAVFGQNLAITPIQLSATTLSGRVITSYTVSGLPQGLVCSRNGLIYGTCLGKNSGVFTATASTGISTQSRLYSYTVDPDALFISTPLNAYSLVPGATVPAIPTVSASHSGLPVTSYSLTQPSYGLTIDASAGIIGGTLNSGAQLIASAPIVLNAVVGIETVSRTFTLTSSTIPVNGQLVLDGSANTITSLYTDISASVVSGARTGTPLSGNVRSNPFNDDETTAASDIQMNGSNVVASLAQLGYGGSTIFGNVVYGNGTSLPLALSANFPTRTLETTSPKPDVLWTLYRSAFSIAYSGSGSTWYALGHGYNIQPNASSNFGQVYLIASYDNGATWTPGYYTSGTPANWALAVTNTGTLPNNPFFAATRDNDAFDRGAVVLRRSGSIYMAGGGSLIYPSTTTPSMIRITSMTGGTPPSGDNATVVPATSVPSGYFLTETRDFALDGPVWVAAGSDSNAVYYTGVPTICSTLRWSDDSGATWYASTNSSDFYYTGIAVAYGGGRWVAIGQDDSSDLSARTCTLKTSSDGKTWSPASTPAGAAISSTSTIAYVNSQWVLSAGGSNVYTNTPTLTGWTLVTSPLSIVSRVSSTFSVVNPFGSNSVLTTPTQDTAIQLTSPLSLGYAVMQYRYITPIVLTLNQSPAYFFVVAGSVPRGLEFDTLSGTFSGMPVLTGKTTVRVYATTGGSAYNYFDFYFEVYSPYPQKRQDTASAFTAYIRQEAIIGGAQFSRDSAARPSKNTTVGAAMGPAPPEVTSPPLPCCIPPPSVKN